MARRRSDPLGPRQPAPRADVAAVRLAQIAAGVGGSGPSSARSAATDPAAEPMEEAWWQGHTRVALPSVAPGVAASPPDDPATEATVPGPSAIRAAGRHAARRGAGPRPAPVTLPAVPMVRPGHVTVVALAVAVALAVTTWWVVRDQPESLASLTAAPVEASAPLTEVAAAPAASDGPATPGTAVSGSPSSAAGSVTVDVAGKVRRPGIVVLPVGSRVTDALAAAGGARRGVDLTSINLARPLVDGEQVLVGVPGAGAAPAAPAPGATAAPGGLVNLNTADAVALEALPQVGPVTAAAIVAWRAEHGGFTSIDELLEVDGIGEATLEQIRPHATL